MSILWTILNPKAKVLARFIETRISYIIYKKKYKCIIIIKYEKLLSSEISLEKIAFENLNVMTTTELAES